MYDLEELHDGGAVVGDGGFSFGVDDQFVHPARTQSRTDSVSDDLGGEGGNLRELHMEMKRQCGSTCRGGGGGQRGCASCFVHCV